MESAFFGLAGFFKFDLSRVTNRRSSSESSDSSLDVNVSLPRVIWDTNLNLDFFTLYFMFRDPHEAFLDSTL